MNTVNQINAQNEPMYRVECIQDEQNIQFAKDIPNMETAVKIALHLHEISNTKHLIHVIHDDIIDVTFIRY